MTAGEPTTGREADGPTVDDVVGTCDWGGCDNDTVALRRDLNRGPTSGRWVSVCWRHRTDSSVAVELVGRDPDEWCFDCRQKHSKCECPAPAAVADNAGEDVKQRIKNALRGAVYPVDIDGAADELLVVVERLQRAAVAEALREAASEVMREHGTASLAAKVLRARAIAVDAL